MVPKLHKKGSSFKGAAAYLLHDKDRAQSVDRVAWVEVRNLAIDDPDTAWRVMAATSMDQDRLKAQAGVKNTGRKSALHVLHYSLSWHEEEAAELTREEMMRAAHGSIRALGADNRQAMIIAHDDEPHPHVHVLVNRVSPENGVILPSSKEKLRLSQWAEAYEKERGTIYCEQRVLNNEARAAEMEKPKKDREFVRGDKDQPRHILDAEDVARTAINDNVSLADRIRQEQRAKDHALAERGRAQQAEHRAGWSELLSTHAARKADIQGQARRDVGAAASEIRSRYEPTRLELLRQQQEALEGFEAGEQSLRGRAVNILKTVNLTRQVRAEDEQKSTLRTYYELLSSSGARKQALERAQELAKRDLQKQQDSELQARKEALQAQEQAQLAENRARLEQERQALVDAQAQERAALQQEWQQRNDERRQALVDLQRQAEVVPPVRREFQQAAQPEPARDQDDSGRDPAAEAAERMAREARLSSQQAQERSAEDAAERMRQELQQAQTPYQQDQSQDRER